MAEGGNVGAGIGVAHVIQGAHPAEGDGEQQIIGKKEEFYIRLHLIILSLMKIMCLVYLRGDLYKVSILC